MNLVSIRLITDDVSRLVDFYEIVTETTADRPHELFAELRTPSGTLAIGQTATVGLFGPGSARPADNHSAIVEFVVDDVEAEYDRLVTALGAAVFVNEPTTMPWGNRSVLLRDPDGTLVNVFAPATPEAVAKFAGVPR